MQVFITSDGEMISILINDGCGKINVNFSSSAPNFFFSEILKIFHEELIYFMIQSDDDALSLIFLLLLIFLLDACSLNGSH